MMKLSSITLLLLTLISRNSEQFRLFHTDEEQSCLYTYYPLIGNGWSLVPYCFPLSSMEIDQTCQGHGDAISFSELRQRNISTTDLFQWHVPIDIIDSYGQFSLHSTSDRIYCNCSNFQWFGLSCEYTFQTPELNFETIIDEQFKSRQSYIQTKRIIFTTYTGLTCRPYGFDLDWRQICNGLIDCDNGEDELHCYLLESNSCDTEREFRCKSGMCIEKSFAYDLMMDCLDQSDEIDMKTIPSCSTNPSIECEEFHCASMNYKYPCGDGECFSTGIGTYTRNAICFNGRNTRFFSVNMTENFCQACLTCHVTRVLPVLDFRNQTSPECARLVNDSLCVTNCQSLFLTDLPLMYPDVQFFYTSTRELFPSLICYNDIKCQLFPPTINITSGLTCRNRSELYSSNVMKFFSGFYVEMHRLFSACALPSSQNRGAVSNLFPCPKTHQFISIYRLDDGIIDCLRSDDDEKSSNICQYNFSDSFSCLTSNDCIRRENLYHNRGRYCQDESDRVYPLRCEYRTDLGCAHRRGWKIPIEYFLFQELCNSQIHPDLIDDETDCEQWQRFCNLKYRQCDGIINCFDRRDEINCQPNRNCKKNEIDHHCYRYPNLNISKSICLPINLIDNGQIDCFGSIDEDIDYCARHYPWNATIRFHCYNDSKCIPLEDICDGISHCPHNDDEKLCPNRLISTQCSPGTYFCNERWEVPVCADKHIRCDGKSTCPDGDDRYGLIYHDEIFCHLITKRIRYKPFLLIDHNQYPPDAIITQMTINHPTSRGVRMGSPLDVYLCHRGIVVRSSIEDDDQCLCPPSYHGKHCQFQSERISISLNIHVTDDHLFPQLVYKLFIRLQTSTNVSYDSMEIYHSTSYNQSLVYKQVVYLKAPQLYEIYSIVIDIFQVSRRNVEYHSSFHYNNTFPFLPVNRLTSQLIIDNRPHSTDHCDNNCSIHGQCRIYSNTLDQSFCLCNAGWSGEFCQLRQSIHCSTRALMFHSHCICPLTFFGGQCYAHMDVCRIRSFCQNGGTCIPVDLRSFQFVCVCPVEFHGIRCEHSSAWINITLKNLWIDDRAKLPIPLVIVQLANITNQISLATIHSRDLFSNVPIDSHVISYSKQWLLPTFAFVQVYFDIQTQSDYYLVALLKQRVHRLVTSILPSNRCPRVNEFLPSSVMSMSYMQRIKHYYRPCLILGTRCFYDEMYICLCDNRAHLDCVRFNHSASRCTTNEQQCLNGGQCYQPIQTSTKFDFTCVCPRCYFGDYCQFTLTRYTISLDALLDQEILIGRPLSAQNSIVRWTFILVLLIVIIGFVSNGFSILTFAQVKPRTIGCGWYLFVSCIVTQFGIVVFGARFLYILHTRIGHLTMNHRSFLSISCITLEYLLSILPSITDWLTACVSIERMIVAIQGIHFNKKKSVYYAKLVIILIISLNITSALHELFYRRIILNSQYNTIRSWCVIEFPSQWLSRYELVTNLFHLIVPFIINCSSIVILLINLVRRKVSLSNTITRKSPLEIVKEQIILYKLVLLSPFILILFGLPRLISSFAFSCFQFQWQKHLILAFYLISSLPMTLNLFIFVLPKPSYKAELIQSLKKIQRFIRTCL